MQILSDDIGLLVDATIGKRLHNSSKDPVNQSPASYFVQNTYDTQPTKEEGIKILEYFDNRENSSAKGVHDDYIQNLMQRNTQEKAIPRYNTGLVTSENIQYHRN